MTVKKQDARSRPYYERESRSASFLELRLNRCPRCLDVRLMHFDLRLEHGHGGIDPHPYEWSVIAFMGSNPNTVQAFLRHMNLSIRHDVKHDYLPSIHTRVLTEPQAPRSEKSIFGWDFCRGISDSHSLYFYFLHQSERKTDSKRLMLCSFAVKAREAGTARRFWFLNRNFHVFCFPFGSFYCGPNFDTIPP
jgi:hypothetical protein